MEIKKARRKSFDVDYVEVTEDNIREVATWCLGKVGGSGRDRFIRLNDKNAINVRQNKAFIGDFVLESETGFKSYSRKAFHKSFQTYEIPVSHEAHRSAETGKFVTEEYAQEHPSTTVREQQEQHARKVEDVELPNDAGFD